jgi:NADPH:quinone reductase-like Zn-dependent oxidoreductase
VSSGIDEAREIAAGRVDVMYLLVEPDHSGLEAIAELVEKGVLRVHVEETFPLAQAARAHEAAEGGGTQGKIVLTVG